MAAAPPSLPYASPPSLIRFLASRTLSTSRATSTVLNPLGYGTRSPGNGGSSGACPSAPGVDTSISGEPSVGTGGPSGSSALMALATSSASLPKTGTCPSLTSSSPPASVLTAPAKSDARPYPLGVLAGGPADCSTLTRSLMMARTRSLPRVSVPSVVVASPPPWSQPRRRFQPRSLRRIV